METEGLSPLQVVERSHAQNKQAMGAWHAEVLDVEAEMLIYLDADAALEGVERAKLKVSLRRVCDAARRVLP